MGRVERSPVLKRKGCAVLAGFRIRHGNKNKLSMRDSSKLFSNFIYGERMATRKKQLLWHRTVIHT